jgi:hypothetical protein
MDVAVRQDDPILSDELNIKFVTHRYCACNKSWSLPPVLFVKTQQNRSDIPGNGKEETDYESSEQETYR